MNIPATLALSAALACTTVQASAQDLRSSRRSISYHTIDIGGLNIFYREAGPADAPTVLLLHGFPILVADVGASAAAARRQISPDRA